MTQMSPMPSPSTLRGSVPASKPRLSRSSASQELTQALAKPAISSVMGCARGTLIRTPGGDVPVENMVPGDRVITYDRGMQRIRWIGHLVLNGTGRYAPVRVAEGILNADAALVLAPGHRVIVRSESTGKKTPPQKLTHIADLLNGRAVARAEAEEMRFYQLMFDNHEIIWTNGVMSESFHVSAASLGALAPRARSAFSAAFPRLAGDPGKYGPVARAVTRPAQQDAASAG